MRFAAPIVLGFLGRHIRTGNLDLSSFTQLLSTEKNNIMRAAPPGLAAAIGAAREREVPFQADRRDMLGDSVPPREPARSASSTAWMWPALGTLAVLVLVWGVRRAHREPRVDTTAVAGGEVATPNTPTTPSAPVAPLAQPGSITLPNGTTLNLPAGG